MHEAVARAARPSSTSERSLQRLPRAGAGPRLVGTTQRVPNSAGAGRAAITLDIEALTPRYQPHGEKCTRHLLQNTTETSETNEG